LETAGRAGSAVAGRCTVIVSAGRGAGRGAGFRPAARRAREERAARFFERTLRGADRRADFAFLAPVLLLTWLPGPGYASSG